MFELLVNLMLTSLFLQSQADNQITIDVLTQEENRLPRAEVVQMQEEAPQQKKHPSGYPKSVSSLFTSVSSSLDRTYPPRWSANPFQTHIAAPPVTMHKMIVPMPYTTRPGTKEVYSSIAALSPTRGLPQGAI